MFKEKNGKLQEECNSLEKSCDGWEDQIKRVESQRDSARLDLTALQTKLDAGGWEDQVKEVKTQRDSAHTGLKSLQQKMDKDTKVIEKGVSDSEVKYTTLKKHYRDLQISCDKDLHNFQSELEHKRSSIQWRRGTGTTAKQGVKTREEAERCQYQATGVECTGRTSFRGGA